MAIKTQLITGIPRSGTTLCCKLLNQRDDVLALHEPINPSALPKDCLAGQAVSEIRQQIKQFDHAIAHGLPFNHGDKGGLEIDNPVGNEQQGGIRQVVAQRGRVQLPPRPSDSYRLVVKQNALFTALLPQLMAHFSILCIVRNPVDVLLSWMTVDLPVNRGRIPAGERFDSDLVASLQGKDCLSRQLHIYQWFVTQFKQSGLPVVPYEQVLATGGKALDNALDFTAVPREPLPAKQRQFNEATQAKLKQAAPQLLALDLGELYSKQSIQQALDKVL